ncbi:MAG: hypothetical protein WDM92_14305 [Caulobacteraceae bacterium]
MEDRITYEEAVRLFADWAPDPAQRKAIGETGLPVLLQLSRA